MKILSSLSLPVMTLFDYFCLSIIHCFLFPITPLIVSSLKFSLYFSCFRVLVLGRLLVLLNFCLIPVESHLLCIFPNFPCLPLFSKSWNPPFASVIYNASKTPQHVFVYSVHLLTLWPNSIVLLPLPEGKVFPHFHFDDIHFPLSSENLKS
jgi:hypothetical protein